ncbi:MAG: hypothetical protein KC636_08440, partial [Myxococcales bacterium]|nr:hypothetical protein [Myxococcales bacterium]
HRFFRLAGALRAQLEADFALDPHFDHPNLFVETREQDTRQAPAYYLAARWLRDAAILPSSALGVFPFDARWWSEARRAHGRDEPPKIALWEPGDGAMTRCPRCDGALRVDAARVDREGWSPAIHTMPLGERCALHAHLVVDARALPLPKGAPGRAELEAGITGQVTLEKVWRLADRIPEPDDHLHA